MSRVESRSTCVLDDVSTLRFGRDSYYDILSTSASPVSYFPGATSLVCTRDPELRRSLKSVVSSLLSRKAVSVTVLSFTPPYCHSEVPVILVPSADLVSYPLFVIRYPLLRLVPPSRSKTP